MNRHKTNGPAKTNGKSGDLPAKHWEDLLDQRFGRLNDIMERQTIIMDKQVDLMTKMDKALAVQSQILEHVQQELRTIRAERP
jgi:hypothetical protein